MTGVSRPVDASNSSFKDSDFQAIARIAKSAFGLHLETSKKALIQSRLSRRLRALGLSEFSDYCALVENKDASERDAFISALTTNVTHFFREPHHFEYFEQKLLPELVARAKSGTRVRIWSAGCSTGQEPYSLAGSVLKASPDMNRFDVQILATDIDPDVLKKAEKAEYRAEDCRFPSDEWRPRVFRTSPGAGSVWRIREDVRKLVSFRRLNLMEPWPMSGQFDAIMCRNVAIYFDKPTQEALWQNFSAKLTPGGTFFIGHSERVHGPAERNLENVGITTYRMRTGLSGAHGTGQ